MDEFVKSKYEDLEDLIVVALAPLLSAGIAIMPFAETDDDYKEVFEKPRISVACHSENPGEELSENISLSEDDIIMHLIIEAKKRRGVNGCYDMRSRAGLLLKGLVFTGFKRLSIGKFMFAERNIKTGVWQYNLEIKTKAVAMQSFDDVTPKYTIPGLAEAMQK